MSAAKTAAHTLAEFANRLTYEQIPAAARERARQCIIDTTGAALFGSRLPWSKIVAGHARNCGGNGSSRVIGTGLKVAPPAAALATACVHTPLNSTACANPAPACIQARFCCLPHSPQVRRKAPAARIF